MTEVLSESRVTPAAAAPAAVRPEIQALRALAVLLVVVYHLSPGRLPGGYVGVDVFFVISGFLITSQLLREINRTGTISLSRFWARRVRRLLPASLLVLAAVALATVALLPDTTWRQYLTEVAASTVYLENWQLAANSVNYLAAEYGGSPVQHFWSLSVEEQFYVVFPLVLLAAVAATRRASPTARRRVLATALGAVTLLSLIVSVVWTRGIPVEAYFVTPTRMWEFGAGGLLAFAGLRAPSGGWAVATSWAGLVAIGGSSLTLTGDSPFPGWLAAVPTLGAIAIIAAGDPNSRLSPTRLGGLRPVQYVGDVSYSVYLWHWPLIVIGGAVLGHALGKWEKLWVVVLTMVLAAATKRWVEDPVRFRSRLVALKPRWTFVVTASAMAALVVGCIGAQAQLDARNAREAQRVLESTAGSCFGAAALDNQCPDPFSLTGAMAPAFAKTDTNLVADPTGGWRCEVPRGEREIRRCTLGSATAPTRTLAMLGDSHAMHLMAPMREIAEREGWRVVTYFKSACSGTGAVDVILTARPDDQGPCADWGAAAIAEIAANPEIDTVVTSNVASAYMQENGSAPISPGRYADAWRTLLGADKNVLVVADVPHTLGQDVPDCLAQARDRQGACDAPAASALPPDAMADAARTFEDGRVRLLDLTDKFCVDGTCHAVIGGSIVYSDASHLTNTYAATLAPYIELALLELVPR